MNENRFDRVTPQPDGTFQHSYRGQPVPAPGAAVEASAALVALAELEKAAKAGPMHPAAIAEWSTKVRAALLPAPSATGVPVDVARTLLRQAELFEQLFNPQDVLDVAGIADTLRAAAGVPPKHDVERSAHLAMVRECAMALFKDIERITRAGKAARVTMLHDEISVEAVR